MVVIGGGVVGAATAFFTSRAGLRTVLIERRPQLCTLTTPAATGAFRLQFDNEEELNLVAESVELFLNFADLTGQRSHDLRVRLPGYLWLTSDPARVQRQAQLVSMQRSWGLNDVELLSGDETRYRFPYVSPSVVAARYRAGDGFLDPKRLTFGLAEGSSATVVTDCEALGFASQGSSLEAVETTRGRIETRNAVVACGPFSGVVAARAGVSLPVETVVRQKVIMPLVPDVPPDAPMTIDEDTGAHWRPALQGAYLLLTDPATPPTAPMEDVPTDRRFAFRLLDPRSSDSVARVSPFWRTVWERGTDHWWLQAGQYTMTPDHRPLIGETALQGLFVNSGYSGHGVMAGPAGSRLLADLVTGQIGAEENPFWPDRAFIPRETDVL